MITRERAVELLRSQLPADLDIDDTHFVEREYGWVFFPQSKNFLRDGDQRSMLLGQGCTLVERTTGRRIDFRSGFSVEESLHIYELGYLTYENWDTGNGDEGNGVMAPQARFGGRLARLPCERLPR